MATVRDTRQTLTFVEGREVLDPKTITSSAWVKIIESTLSVVKLKLLHGFKPASNILTTAIPEHEAVSFYSSDAPPRIRFGAQGSREFMWTHDFLVCAIRHGFPSGWVPKEFIPPEEVPCEYLLLGRDGHFCLLSTVWTLRQQKNPAPPGALTRMVYSRSNDTEHHLKASAFHFKQVVEWCLKDKQNGPYLLRGIIKRLHDATTETVKKLSGKLERVARQGRDIDQRLSSISWVKPGDVVWIVCHSHSWDRNLNNEYFPIARKVLRVEDGVAYFREASPKPLWDCYMTKNECQAVCPDSHRDE